jgi:hypothetical protein
MSDIHLSGFLFNASGAALESATVEAFAKNTVTETGGTAVGSTTTNSSGYYTLTVTSDNEYDVRITSGNSVRWRRFDDRVQIEEIEVSTLNIREGATAQVYTIAPGSISADRTLTLPAATGSDTLASLGLAQTFSAAQTYSAGITSTAASNTLGATSFNDAAITNVSDIALDSISADGTDINIAVDDNSATALTIKQGSDAYLIIDTANSSESVSIGTGISGTAITLGHGTSEVTVTDNLTVSGNLTVTGTTTSVDSTTINVTNAFIFEGATADAHETTLGIIDPTADATINLPAMGAGTYYLPVLAAATTATITSTPAELNLLDTAAANSVVNSKAVIYGSGGELAGTLSTAAQANVTTLAGLTSLGAAGATTNVVAGDVTMYNAVNCGDPTISLGSASAERLIITANYDACAQTLCNVEFSTAAASGTANKGKFVFDVDGTDIVTIDDGGIDLASGKTFAINGSDVSTSDTTYCAGTLLDLSGTTFNVDLTEAGAATVAAGDYMLFLDGGTTGTHAKGSVHDIASLFSGSGLSASSSVMSVDAAQTVITSIFATDVKIGEDDQTKVDFADANIINLHANNIKAASIHNTSSKGDLRLYEACNYVSITPPALSANWTLTLPANDGGACQFLQTNGSGVTSWAAAGATAPVFARVVRTAGNMTTTSTSLEDVTGATVTFATGAFPVAYGASQTLQHDTGPGSFIVLNIKIDCDLEFGVQGMLYGTGSGDNGRNRPFHIAGQSAALSGACHTIKEQWAVGSGTGTLLAINCQPHIFWAHEIR